MPSRLLLFAHCRPLSPASVAGVAAAARLYRRFEQIGTFLCACTSRCNEWQGVASGRAQQRGMRAAIGARRRAWAGVAAPVAQRSGGRAARAGDRAGSGGTGRAQRASGRRRARSSAGRRSRSRASAASSTTSSTARPGRASRCGRRWDTNQIPREQYEVVRRTQLRFRVRRVVLGLLVSRARGSHADRQPLQRRPCAPVGLSVWFVFRARAIAGATRGDRRSAEVGADPE